MDNIIKWIDYETLLLIFSMMVLVAILIDTGIFDYIAVYTFQVSRRIYSVWLNNKNSIFLSLSLSSAEQRSHLAPYQHSMRHKRSHLNVPRQRYNDSPDDTNYGQTV